MSRLDTPRRYSIVVLKGNSSVEQIVTVTATDAGLAFKAARDAGYTPIAIHLVE